MSKFLYGSFSSVTNAMKYLIEHINNNGGEASAATDSYAINIVKWNNIENVTFSFYSNSPNVTLFVRDEIDNEAVFCYGTGKYDFTYNMYFCYLIHLNDGSIVQEAETNISTYTTFPIPQFIYTKKTSFNIAKMLCVRISKTTMHSIADRDLYTADALIDTGVIYTDALGNKFIGAAPFILCKYDE